MQMTIQNQKPIFWLSGQFLPLRCEHFLDIFSLLSRFFIVTSDSFTNIIILETYLGTNDTKQGFRTVISIAGALCQINFQPVKH